MVYLKGKPLILSITEGTATTHVLDGKVAVTRGIDGNPTEGPAMPIKPDDVRCTGVATAENGRDGRVTGPGPRQASIWVKAPPR
jgi:hypothetical protein